MSCFCPSTPSTFRWLLYEEPGFQGVPLMLEPGEYPNLLFWEKKEAYIRSMRPLKMVNYRYYLQFELPMFMCYKSCIKVARIFKTYKNLTLFKNPKILVYKILEFTTFDCIHLCH